jgi:predicted dehydrogenase
VTVRVGFLGCGFIARYHAFQLAVAEEPHVIAAVHDHDRARAEAFAASEGGAVCDSVEEVAGSSDVVLVCTWTAAHRDLVAAVAATGTPLLCEKPLGVDLDDARAVAAAARVPGSSPFALTGLVLRTSPAMLALREMVREPGGGRVMNVVLRDDQFIPTRGMYESDWRGDPRRAGSGTLLEHSIHDVDLLEWLFGPLATVSAQQAFFHGLDRIEDSVSVVGRFASGASVTLASVWHDVLARPSMRRIEVFCERRLVTLEGDLFGPVHSQSDDGERCLEASELISWLQDRGVRPTSTEQRLLAAVAAAGRGEEVAPLRPDVEDALRAHVVVDAIYRSAAADGAAVQVPPPQRPAEGP